MYRLEYMRLRDAMRCDEMASATLLLTNVNF